MGQTIAQKILANHAGRNEAEVGEILNPQVDVAMSHENAALVSKVFKTIGVEKVWDPAKIIIPLDHRVPANDIKTAEGHKWIRGIVKEYEIENFYDIRAGICHQVLPEKGHVKPGMLIVGTDSHTTTYGGLGAFSTGIGATEMAAVWATGGLWMKVPETLKINVDGKLDSGVYSKDVILKVIGTLGAEGADYKSCEFYGSTFDDFTVSSRMCVSNQAMEMGAKAAICPPDEKTFAYLRERTDGIFNPVYADDDATYEAIHDFAAPDIAPQISCPHHVDNTCDVDDKKVAEIQIQQAVLGSCTNGRLEDLEAAARILKGKTIPMSVRMVVIPASQKVYLDAIEAGYIQTFIESGAVVLNAGCGPCLGAHQGILASGERAISSTNRNFRGRMGSPDAEVYLASPATVAASALKGCIADPREVN